MSVKPRQTIERAIKQNLPVYQTGLGLRDFLYKFGIIISGAFFVFLLILLKSKTVTDFQLEPHLFSYAIFVTTFELSRIIYSMLYESSFTW